MEEEYEHRSCRVNHNLAPINVREAVSFTDTKKIEVINILLDKEIEEVVIISTCNRSEIYINAENIDIKLMNYQIFMSSILGKRYK